MKKKLQDNTVSASAEETLNFGRTLANNLLPGAVLALKGDLGAGKTTLAKGIVAALTGEAVNHIQSPTFTYLILYETPTLSVCHFDLYRLTQSSHFIDMGFPDYFDGKGICIIEWPERIDNLLPPQTTHISISHMNEGKRGIDVQEG